MLTGIFAEEMVQNGQLPANNWKGKYLNKYETVKSLPRIKKTVCLS